MLVIGQCSRTVKETVNTSCLCKRTERVMCMRCCVFLFVFCLFVFLMKTYYRFLVSFSNFVIVLINLDFVDHSYDYRLNWTPSALLPL